MPKKKKEVSETDEFELDIDKIDSEIKKLYGNLVLRDVTEILESPPIVIPISPAFDLALGGGITEGIRTNISGPPKAGKTVTALSIAAQCQKPEYGGEFCPEGRIVFFYNIEGRIKVRDLQGIKGLDLSPEKFRLIGSVRGKILDAQDYLNIADKLIREVPGSVHIFDSYSQLCTKDEATTDMEKMQMASGAKLLAKFSRKTSNIIPVNKSVVIGINHVYANIGGYGGAVDGGGNAKEFSSDTKLRCSHFEPIKISEKEDAVQIGQKVHWKVIWSALNAPGTKFSSFIRYGEGIDKERELVEIATAVGLITKGDKGAWYKFSFLEDAPSFCGAEKSREALVENPEWYAICYKKFKEMMGL